MNSKIPTREDLEIDTTEVRARLRAKDEFKITHKRGFGNVFVKQPKITFAEFLRSEEHTSELQVTSGYLVCKLLVGRRRSTKLFVKIGRNLRPQAVKNRPQWPLL
uniref:Uncharacterized protein n=1 Tax=Cacopsylla melanoneura TaxID=428564 RepID=A0A8D8WYD6_9HEMI